MYRSRIVTWLSPAALLAHRKRNPFGATCSVSCAATLRRRNADAWCRLLTPNQFIFLAEDYKSLQDLALRRRPPLETCMQTVNTTYSFASTLTASEWNLSRSPGSVQESALCQSRRGLVIGEDGGTSKGCSCKDRSSSEKMSAHLLLLRCVRGARVLRRGPSSSRKPKR